MFCLSSSTLEAQFINPGFVRPAPLPPSANPNIRIRPLRPNAPGPNEVLVTAAVQEQIGKVTKLRGGRVEIETQETLIRADEIDYDEETGDAEARGNVYFKHYEGSEELWADRVEYNVSDQEATFYNVRGSAPGKIDQRPGVLTTNNPFVFQGEWAERHGKRYILHNGFVTNCKLPKPIWTLKASRFDIIPHERAIAYKSWFKVRGFPIFYTPIFRKSLQRQPRQSGFLTTLIGNSSRRGKTIYTGYYWAINRSYDLTYRPIYYTQRGLAHNVDFRGKPYANADFDFNLNGINDRGALQPNGDRIKQGGVFITTSIRAQLPDGWQARASLNYLSSFKYRASFTETLTEAISSEVASVGYVTKHWSSYGINIGVTRKENFLSQADGDKISIRRLPEIDFISRDRQISDKVLPIWVSLDSSAALLSRSQPLFETRSFVERFDVEPRIMTAIRWKDFNIIPAFSVRETFEGSSFNPQTNRVLGANVDRHAREFTLDIVPPSIAKIFDTPKWMGSKMKHVIEPRVSFRYVSGIHDFTDLVRFDETELMSNTTEVEFSVANRFYVKRASGEIFEAFSWQVWQRRYFDPTFGGALLDTRNVLLTGLQLTGYTFFSGPRNYSPIVSSMRLSPIPNIGVEWRADYDPLLGRFTNSSITGDARISRYWFSAGHAYVKPDERLTAPFNQFRAAIGVGNENRKGWNGAFNIYYDFREKALQFITTQVTYNLDCCGVSFQYTYFGIGRNDKYYRVSFAVANIGSFGNLKRQQRLF